MTNEQKTYYKIESNKKKYYIDNKLVGEEFQVIKYLINVKHISSSKAHKVLAKIKEWKEKK